MATVNSRQIVDDIIAGNGHYEDDPLVIRIVQYNNMFDGGIAYGLTYEHEDPMRYLTAPACHNPVIVWDINKAKERNGS